VFCLVERIVRKVFQIITRLMLTTGVAILSTQKVIQATFEHHTGTCFIMVAMFIMHPRACRISETDDMHFSRKNTGSYDDSPLQNVFLAVVVLMRCLTTWDGVERKFAVRIFSADGTLQSDFKRLPNRAKLASYIPNFFLQFSLRRGCNQTLRQKSSHRNRHHAALLISDDSPSHPFPVPTSCCR